MLQNENITQQSQPLTCQAMETEKPDFIQDENSNGESDIGDNDNTVDDNENGIVERTVCEERLDINQRNCVTVKIFDGPALAHMIITKKKEKSSTIMLTNNSSPMC